MRRVGTRARLSERRERWATIGVLVLLLLGSKSYPLLAQGRSLLVAAGAGAVLATVGMYFAVERSPALRELRHWRRRGFFHRVGSSLLTLSASLFGALIAVAVFPSANGVLDSGPVRRIAYEVVEGPVNSRRRPNWVRLRPLDGSSEEVILRVRARMQPTWVGDTVLLDVRRGRLGEPWIAGYEHLPPPSPELDPPAVSGGHCLPAYERLKGPCPPP